MLKRRLTLFLLVFAIFLCFVSGVGANAIKTNGNKIDITDLSIVTDYGVLTGQLYVPKTATPSSQMPAVILSHGYLNSSEMQDAFAVELSRKGFVVMTVSMYAHGSSTLHDYFNEAVNSFFVPLVAANGYGLYDAVNYVYGLGFVDNTQIGLGGHSLGGLSTNQAVYLDDLWVQQQRDLGNMVSPKISSVLLMGADPNYGASLITESDIPISSSYYGPRNVGVIAAQYDEFFFMGADYPAPRDYLLGENAHLFVNSVNLSANVQTATPVVNALKDNVNGYYYGTVDYFGSTTTKQYIRVIYSPAEIHAWNHFSVVSTGAAVEFFSKTVASNITMVPSNLADSMFTQSWWVKEMFTLIGLVGFFLFVIPFVMVMTKTSFFASLRASEEPAINKKAVGKLGVSVYWTGFGLTMILSAVTFLYLTQWINRIGEPGFPGVSASITQFFNQPTTNEIGGWAVANAVIIIGIYFISNLINKKYGKTEELMTFKQLDGVKINISNLGKTFLLSLLVLFATFSLVFATDFFFNTDFRFWTLAVKVFESYHFVTAIKYVFLFGSFFVASSFVINKSLARSDRKESLNILLSIIGIIGGLVLVLLVQYLGFFITGERVFMDQNLRPILAFATIPLLAISAVFSRVLYRKTGSIWLGAFINTMFITMITVANTATFLV